MKWIVVVPTCRPESFRQFMVAWTSLFKRHDVHLIVILDTHDQGFRVWDNVEVYRREDLPSFIPTGTDMCRSFGIYKAWCAGAEYTLTLDDDVRPHGDPFQAYEAVFESGAPVSSYLDVGALTTYDGQLRGFPFRDRERREVAVQYGGWHGVLDYDAPTQLAGVNDQEWFDRVVLPVPKGAAVTGCIMNAAWKTRYAPIMWQLPLLQGRYNRFGDIWGGLFQKRVCDALEVAVVVNGLASVRHERASDPEKNMERERPGIPVNEHLWDELATDGGTMIAAYRSVTDSACDYFAGLDHEYAQHFRAARDAWLALFA